MTGRRIILVFGLLLTVNPAYAADSSPGHGGLLLVGGYLPVCSSMSVEQCRKSVDWAPAARHGARFQLSKPAIVRWQDAVGPSIAPSAELVQALNRLAGRNPLPMTAFELAEWLRQELPTSLSPDRLSDPAWLALRDHLELPRTDPSGLERVEALRLGASRDQASVEIFQRFVAMAGKAGRTERPTIVVLTTSSRDPTDAVDFYLQAFEQAGARSIWLPLDAALRAARADGACARLAEYQARHLGVYERWRVAPQRFMEQLAFCGQDDAGLELIEKADGIFFNGGDQSLTLAALVDEDGQPTRELERLRQRFDAGTLAVGGTSAGSAVQASGFMLTGGGNREALAHGPNLQPPTPPGCDRDGSCPEGVRAGQLTLRSGGGLGLFTPGLVDTHFSERMRQFRLAVALKSLPARVAVGVDETTALEVNAGSGPDRLKLAAHGAAAAWIMVDDRGRADDQRLLLHRLPAGIGLTMAADGRVLETGLESWSRPAASDTAGDQPCLQADELDSYNALLETSPLSTSLCVEMTDSLGKRHRLELTADQDSRKARIAGSAVLVDWRLGLNPMP